MCASTWYPAFGTQSSSSPLTAKYEWTQLEFDYATEAEREQAIANGDFSQISLAPIDVDVYHEGNKKSKIFVTIPRFPTGVPATLGTVTDKMRDGNPIIAPYPSWSWHQNLNDCLPDRIVSVFRVKIDECGRLWVLDAGRIVDTRICPAQLLVFDVQTNELLDRYEIPNDQLYSNSILVTPIVDVRDPHTGCRDTFVYMADCQAMSLIVYDMQRKTSWRIIDKTMYPSPEFGTYHLAGQEFELMDGLLGMDLSPYKSGEDRILYYHAMSSNTEHRVYTSLIRNQSIFIHDPTAAPQIFYTYPGRRSTQAPAQAIDKNGISYFGLVSDMSMNCWNTAADYGERNIGVLAQSNRLLQFASGVKVINNRRGAQELWVVTMRFQKLATGTVNPSETNFRILKANIEDLTRGSKCLNVPPNQNHRPNKGQGNRPSYAGSGYGYGRNSKREINPIVFPDS
ncbi:hypothetical protein ILUMI_02008 [Ignelater luminosus]|uniref:Major royal jelly protein n=1 Tax=Ignelater luminosus TaxID=2038154 RepID=A0A8K0GL76_IGNLU|nr:hypothetical protein ILUMI_02008 [Ignelater luminosus]